MKKTTARVCPDETAVEILEGGGDRALHPQPTAAEAMAKARPVPRVKMLRRALGLTQEEFSVRYRIPLGTLRDWEQGRTEPDRPARAYLKVIASNPEWVSRVLDGSPGEADGCIAPAIGASRCA